MRDVSTAELAALTASQQIQAFRFWVANSSGTLVEFTDFVMDWSIDADADRNTKTLDVRLHREVSGTSLAPGMAASRAARPISNERAVMLETLVLEEGDTPTSGDYIELFTGTVKGLEWGGNNSILSIACADAMAVIHDTWIETPAEYGAAAPGEAISTTMQTLIDDTLASDAPTMTTVGDPDTNVLLYTQDRSSLAQALQRLQDLIGWDLRYEWSDASGADVLTFREPPRSNTTPDYTFSLNDYEEIPTASEDTDGIRNAVEVLWSETESQVAEDATSIAEFGRRYMAFDSRRDPQINTSAKALALATAAVADLANPPVTSVVRGAFWWPAQIHDFYSFASNSMHFASALAGAVTGYTHAWVPDVGLVTTFRLRERASGGVTRWYKKAYEAATVRQDEEILPTLPAIAEGEVTFNETGNAIVRVRATDGLSVRIAEDASAFPDSAAIGAESVEGTDGAGWVEVTLADTYAYDADAYIAGLAYQYADGSGLAQITPWQKKATRVRTTLDGRIWAVSTNAVTGIYGTAAGPASLFPATLKVWRDDPEGTPLVDSTIAASGDTFGPTGSGKTTEYAALTNIALPLAGAVVFYATITGANGVAIDVSTTAERAKNPNGSVVPDDYSSTPALRCNYNTDVAEIVVTTPSGTKTYTSLSGGGTVTYTVGATLDNLSTESPIADDGTRSGYSVAYYSATSGGGIQRDMWSGSLHGAPLKPTLPRVTIRTTVTNDTADLFVDYAGEAYNYDLDVSVYRGDPTTGTLLQSFTVSADGTKGPSDYAAFDDIALPDKEAVLFYAVWEDNLGNKDVSVCAADRDGIPGGVVTPFDLVAAAGFKIVYDDDTTQVVVNRPGGSGTAYTKTYSGLSGGGTITFTLGTTVMDDATTTPAVLAEGERSGEWFIEFTGGGQTLELWRGYLEGARVEFETRYDDVTYAALTATINAATAYKNDSTSGQTLGYKEGASAWADAPTNPDDITVNRPAYDAGDKEVIIGVKDGSNYRGQQSITIKEQTRPALASVEYNSAPFDDGTDLDLEVNFTFDGNVNTTDHTLTIITYVDDVRVDAETSIAVNSSLPYSFSVTGGGNLGPGDHYARAEVLLVATASGAYIDTMLIPPELIAS